MKTKKKKENRKKERKIGNSKPQQMQNARAYKGDTMA